MNDDVISFLKTDDDDSDLVISRMSSTKVYIVGVGVTKFEKPGKRQGVDYTDYVLQAASKALLDANINYDRVQCAAAGYCFGLFR